MELHHQPAAKWLKPRFYCELIPERPLSSSVRCVSDKKEFSPTQRFTVPSDAGRLSSGRHQERTYYGSLGIGGTSAPVSYLQSANARARVAQPMGGTFFRRSTPKSRSHRVGHKLRDLLCNLRCERNDCRQCFSGLDQAGPRYP